MYKTIAKLLSCPSVYLMLQTIVTSVTTLIVYLYTKRTMDKMYREEREMLMIVMAQPRSPREKEIQELRNFISVFDYIVEHCRSEHRIISEAEAIQYLYGKEKYAFDGLCEWAVRKASAVRDWECKSKWECKNCLLYEYLPGKSRSRVSLEQSISPCDLLGYADYIEAVTANGTQGEQVEQIAEKAEKFRDKLKEIEQSIVSPLYRPYDIDDK